MQGLDVGYGWGHFSGAGVVHRIVLVVWVFPLLGQTHRSAAVWVGLSGSGPRRHRFQILPGLPDALGVFWFSISRGPRKPFFVCPGPRRRARRRGFFGVRRRITGAGAWRDSAIDGKLSPESQIFDRDRHDCLSTEGGQCYGPRIGRQRPAGGQEVFRVGLSAAVRSTVVRTASVPNERGTLREGQPGRIRGMMSERGTMATHVAIVVG